MSFLTDHLNKLMEDAVARHGRAKTRILVEAGVVPGQFFNGLKGKKPWPDSILQALGDSGLFDTTADELLALKALEEYEPSVILEAHKLLVERGLVEPLPRVSLAEGESREQQPPHNAKDNDLRSTP